MSKQQDAKVRAVNAADQELEASLTSLKASTDRLEANITDFQRIGRQHRLDVHAGEGVSHVFHHHRGFPCCAKHILIPAHEMLNAGVKMSRHDAQ